MIYSGHCSYQLGDVSEFIGSVSFDDLPFEVSSLSFEQSDAIDEISEALSLYGFDEMIMSEEPSLDSRCIESLWSSDISSDEYGTDISFCISDSVRQLSPNKPYGNFFLYQKPIEHRILFWQTFKYHGSGFLYWEVNYWNRGNPLNNLRAGVTFDKNMDGKLIYPGSNGPIGSIRYENIRDGIEDYDYLVLLRKVFQKKGISEKVRKKIRYLLNIPSSLIVSPSKFTHNSDVLLGFRAQIGEILDRYCKDISIGPRN